MDELQQQLRATFLDEAKDVLEGLEGAFLEWEADRGNTQVIDKIFRLAHNLKGSSKAVGFMEIGAFTHDLESLMLKIKNKEMAVSQTVFDLLLVCNDELAKMVNAQRAGVDTAAAPDLVARLKDVLAGNLGEAAPAPAPEIAGFGVFDDGTVAPVLVADAPFAAPPAAPSSAPQPVAAAPAAEKRPAADDSMRVSLERVDSLVRMIGELVILQTVLSQQRHLVASPLLQKTIVQLDKITKEIQDTSMGLRMVPLKQTFQKMQRIVRDTSKALGKDIDLELAGEDTELDKTVVDQLGDPLVHLIRNACDHGIEMPDDRTAAGKPGKGTIRLAAGHEGGKIKLTITDDGKGLDAKKLREKAVEKGLIKASQPLSDTECHNLIFAAGFSTKAAVTDLSGRGVGMDVVKTNVEKALKGEVQLATVLGQGTTITIYLPLTLAIIDGMVVRSGTERYIVPLTQVHESVRPRPGDVQVASGIGEVLTLRGESLPLFRLSSQLGARKGDGPQGGETAIVVRAGQQAFAIAVDEILARQQVVIKRLGPEVRQVRGITGGAVLGDGTAALILDLNELVRRETRARGAAA